MGYENDDDRVFLTKAKLKEFGDDWNRLAADAKDRFETIEKNLEELAKKNARVPTGMIDSKEDAEHMLAFKFFLRTGDVHELRTFQKSMSIGTNADGGYTVPTSLGNDIIKVAQNFSPMRQLARVIKPPRANYVEVVDTGGDASEWVAETGTRSDTATPTLAQVTFNHGEVSSIAPVTRWLLEDSEYDIARFVADFTGRRHGVSEGDAFINGNGTNKPKGILAYTFAATADSSRAFGQLEKLHSGSAGSFDVDDLIDLFYKLKPAYQANASWLMHETTLAFVRKLKSSAGDYLWEPATQAGQPSTLLGRPVYVDSNMPVMASAAHAILCGDFKAGYSVLDIGQPVMIRDDLTTKGYVKFYVARRVGGGVVDSNAIKALTLSV